LVYCPSCLASDARLSRPRQAFNLVTRVLLATPLRCCRCAKRFYGRPGGAHFPRIALGRSHWPVPDVLPIAESRAQPILVVDSSIPLSKLIRETLTCRGFAVLGAKSPDEGLELFQAHQPQIDLVVIDLAAPAAGILDLTAELERLRPGLPVLYLVGEAKSIARCSIEAQAPGSVLAIPFTEEQLIARVGGLLEAAACHRPGEQLWERLIAVSDWIPSPTAMLHVYETRQAEFAATHVALLSAGGVQYAFGPTNSKAAPYGVTVCAKDVALARRLIEPVSAGGRFIVAA
jgi:DNA-binding response OmpR family regulator